MNILALFDELEKLGAVSAEDARRSLDRLDTLERSKPTAEQAVRYGTLGALAGGATKAISHGIEHGKMPGVRGVLGAAAGGAIGMGALPLVRAHLDRRAEKSKLREFMKQGFEASAYSTPIEGAKPNIMESRGPMRGMPITSAFPRPKVASELVKKEMPYLHTVYKDPKIIPHAELEEAAGWIQKHPEARPKVAFEVSQYSGPLSMGKFPLVSGLPPASRPSLQSTFQGKQDALQMAKSSGAMVQTGITPAAKLQSAQSIGSPKITQPTFSGQPSQADLSKPIGFGMKLPGAVKGTL